MVKDPFYVIGYLEKMLKDFRIFLIHIDLIFLRKSFCRGRFITLEAKWWNRFIT
jgi:hypothetical protein